MFSFGSGGGSGAANFWHPFVGCTFDLAGNSELRGIRRGDARAVRYGRQIIWLAALTLVLFLHTTASALAETRTISFRNMHTNETLTVVYKRNGQFVPDAMRQINQVLRDWRRNESIRMNPKLIDLAYEVHKATGSAEPINVVSGYRSPVTNAALRRRSRGVARNSQHILGNAMDIYIPDVSVKKIREVALRFQRGGVGYYPTSRRPFVHIDVGSVRHWPRMSPQQLAQVFPDGDTLHVPTGGKPLPRTAPSTRIQVASATTAPQNPAPAQASAPAQRQQFVRPTPGVDPLIVASISPDASAPLASGSTVNPLALLGIGGEDTPAQTASTSQSPSAQPADLSEEFATFDVASVPLPNLRPVQLASLDNETDVAAEQQPFDIASVMPLPTTRPLAASGSSSGIALGYADPQSAPAVDQSSFELASLVEDNPPLPSMRATSPGRTQLDSSLMATMIEEELSDGATGIWASGLDYKYPVSRDLVSSERAEGQAFAQLQAPQLTNLQDLSTQPRYILTLSFSSTAQNRTPSNQFRGPAVQPLRFALAS